MAAALAASLVVLTSIPAAAATIGSASGNTACQGGQDTIQLTSAATSASYIVPAGGGLISDWSTQAGTDTGPAGLLVWRKTATAGTFTLVAESPVVTLTPNAMNKFVLATQIPVQAGDLLGLRTMGRIECTATGVAGDVIGSRFGAHPLVGGTEVLLTDAIPFTLNVAATLGTPTVTPPPTGGGENESGDNQEGEHGDNGDGRDHNKDNRETHTVSERGDGARGNRGD